MNDSSRVWGRWEFLLHCTSKLVWMYKDPIIYSYPPLTTPANIVPQKICSFCSSKQQGIVRHNDMGQSLAAAFCNPRIPFSPPGHFKHPTPVLICTVLQNVHTFSMYVGMDIRLWHEDTIYLCGRNKIDFVLMPCTVIGLYNTIEKTKTICPFNIWWNFKN